MKLVGFSSSYDPAWSSTVDAIASAELSPKREEPDSVICSDLEPNNNLSTPETLLTRACFDRMDGPSGDSAALQQANLGLAGLGLGPLVTADEHVITGDAGYGATALRLGLTTAAPGLTSSTFADHWRPIHAPMVMAHERSFTATHSISILDRPRDGMGCSNSIAGDPDDD